MIAADRLGWALTTACWLVLVGSFIEGARIELTLAAVALAAAVPGGR